MSSHVKSADNGRRQPNLRVPQVVKRYGPYVGVGAAVVLVAGTLLGVGVMQDLPDVKDLARMEGGGGVVYRYRDQVKPMTVEGSRPGPMVDTEHLPAYVSQAFIAIEDKRFATNSGIDLQSLGRAALVNFKAGRSAQGGSTITQQLVRKVLLHDNAKTLTRKIQEALLAMKATSYFGDKDRIMRMYLTSLDYNRRSIGIDDAARTYFNKNAKDLTISEAALLAGMINGPSLYDPIRNYDRSWKRGRLVLSEMYKQGYLDAAAYQRALDDPPKLASTRSRSWEFAVRRVRYEHDGDAAYYPNLSRTKGTTLFVNMTLDADAQALAEDVVDETLVNYPQLETVFVAADGDGAVRALVGSRRFQETDGYSLEPQQMGSVFKAFVYAAAMEAGARPDSLCLDRPGIPSWNVSNHGGVYANAPIPLDRAFAVSSNVVAARLGAEVGYDSVAGLSRGFGLEATPPRVPSWPLVAENTPLNVAQAFLPFANGGYAAPLHFRDAILNYKKEDVGDPRRGRGGRVVQPETLSSMHRLMRGVVTRPGATGERGNTPGRWIGGKTGTSGTREETYDLWFAGYGRGYVIVVWVGRPDNGPLPPKLYGGGLPAEMASRFLRRQKLGWGAPPMELEDDPTDGVPADAASAPPGTFRGPASPPPAEGCAGPAF